MMPARRPITTPPMGPTQPQAGVIATRPATAPDTPPSKLGWPRVTHSPRVQAKAAAAVARIVFKKARPVRPLASRFDPALKPNQPTHSRHAPIMVIGRLWGARTSLPRPRRLPRTRAQTRPATPALMCTTEPPAKSMAPQLNSQPLEAFTAAP